MKLLNFTIYMSKNKFRALSILAIISVSIFGCKKYIEVDIPSQLISPENAFKNNQIAASVLTGIYAKISSGQILFDANLVSSSLIPELSADNLTLYDPIASTYYTDFYQNSLEPKYQNSDGAPSTYWYQIYPLIYTVNSAIEGLKDNTALSSEVQKRLLGEAYFMRGFLYFYLVNFYGGIPLVTSTKYDQTAQLPRNTADEVYTQISVDLAFAEGLLDYTYVGPTLTSTTSDRVRPNLAAVQALEARVFLYRKKYPEAEAAATKVIGQSSFSLAELSQTFVKNSSETIWALQPVNPGYSTSEGYLFTLPDYGPDPYTYPTYISESLLTSFEKGDDRKNKWLGNVTVDGITYYYPSKYKAGFTGTNDAIEYTIVLRIAEQYLIRAEARNEQGNTGGAIDDLNAIRDRSRAAKTIDVLDPLPDLNATLAQNKVRTAVLQERRVELFTEWAHRWFDLKRSSTLDAVMTPATKTKGGIWSNYKSLYPIPLDEILINKFLTQNPGYVD